MTDLPLALTQEAFAGLMEPLTPEEAVAIAVSGGGDSMALLRLTRDWALQRRLPLTAYTVDHGLRPAAAGEARQVAAWCARLDVPHKTLCWRGEKPASRLQERAREARYALLAAACEADGVKTLLVGHTEDDQAETVLQRLAHRSGPDGLAGMDAAVRIAAGAGAPVRMLRPLLCVSRGALRATLRAMGQDFLDDPSNDDLAFERVRTRKALASLAQEEVLTGEDLAVAAAGLAPRRAAMRQAAGALVRTEHSLLETGVCLPVLDTFLEAPDATARSALQRMVFACGGGLYPPSQDQAAAVLDALRRYDNVRRTLGGCFIEKTRGSFAIFREPSGLFGRSGQDPAARTPMTAEGVVWDRRYIVRFTDAGLDPQPLAVGALGYEGLAQLPDQESELSRAVQAVLPAVWAGEELLAQPHLGYAAPGAQRLAEAVEMEFLGRERFYGAVTRFPAVKQN